MRNRSTTRTSGGRMSSRAATRQRARLALAVGAGLLFCEHTTAQAIFTWGISTTGVQNWGTASNWVGGAAFPGSNSNTANDDIALFSTAGNSGTIGLSFGALGTPYYLGAISHAATTRTIGSSGATPGVLTLNTSLISGSQMFINSTATSGTLTLAGTVTGGTGSMSLALANSGTIHVNASGASVNISAIVNETGSARSITKTGAGRLVLSGQNTFSGNFNLTSGTLLLGASSIGTPGVVASGPVGTGQLVLSGGTLSAALRTLHNDVVLNGNIGLSGGTLAGGFSLGSSTRTLTLDPNTTVISGVISGSPGVGLIRTNAGQLRITNTANTYDGGTTISSGGLMLESDATGAAASVLGPGPITFAGGHLISSDLTVRNVANNVAATGNINAYTINFSGSTFNLGGTTRNCFLQAVTIASQITNGGITLQDGSDLALTNNSNSYALGMTVGGGILRISNDGQLGAAGIQLALGGTGTLAIASPSGVTLSRPVAFSTTPTLDVTSSHATGLTISGLISGTPISVTQLGGGTVTVTNASNNFTGGTSAWNIQNGTLSVGASGALAASTYNISSTGALYLNGFGDNAGRLVGSGLVDLGANGSLQIGGTSYQEFSFSGAITGTGTIRKSLGVWNYSGAMSPNIGLMAINTERVRLGTLGSVPSGTGSISIASGSVVAAMFEGASQSNFLSRFDGSATAGVVAIGADTSNPFDFSSVFGSSSQVRFAGEWDGVTSDNFYAAYTASSLTPPGNVYYLGGAVGRLIIPNGVLIDNGMTPRSLDVNRTGVEPTGMVQLNGNNTFSGPVTISAGELVVGAAPQIIGTPNPLGIGAGAVSISGVSASVPGVITFVASGTTNRPYTIGNFAQINVASGQEVALNGGLTGTGTLLKNGNGVLTLGGTAGYATSTNINAGMISIADSTYINSGVVNMGMATAPQSGPMLRVTSNITVPNNMVIIQGTVPGNNRFSGVEVPSGVSATVNGVISNSPASTSGGGFAKFGPGTLTSTAANTSFGGVTVFQGTLALAGASGAFANATGNNGIGSVPPVSGLAVDRNATFVLDNTTANNNSRTPSTWNTNLNGGEFALVGNPSVNSSASIGNLFASAPATLTVTPGSASTSATMNVGTMSTLTGLYTWLLVRGNGLGSAAPGTAGVASVVPTNWIISGAGGAPGSTTMSIMHHVIADTSSTGGGMGFAYRDATTGVRPLASGEYATTFVPGASTLLNLKATGATASVSRPTFLNSLYMTNTTTLSSSALLTTGAGSVFQESGTGTISGGYLASPNGTDLSIWTAGKLVENGAVHTSKVFYKGGAGTLELNGPLVVGGGFLTLAGGTVDFGASSMISPSSRVSAFNSYVDLSGADREIGGLSGAQANGLVLGNATINLGSNRLTVGRMMTAQVFDGTVVGTGGIDVVIGAHGFAAGTQTFSNALLYSGPTNIRGGTLQLVGAQGALASTSAINVTGGTLRLNNVDNGNISWFNNNRLPDAAPVNLNGGEMRLVGNSQSVVSENIGALSIAGAAKIAIESGGSQLNTPSITRAPRSTLVVESVNLGGRSGTLSSLNIISATPPTLVGGGGAPGSTNISILPWAVTTNSGYVESFITYGSSRGMRPLKNTEYAPIVEGSTTTNNVKLNGENFMGGLTTTANAFWCDSGGVTGSGTLVPSSGAIALRGYTLELKLNFGSTEGIVFGGGQVIGPIYGSQGVVFSQGDFDFPAGGSFMGSGPLAFNRANMRIDLSSGLLTSQALEFSSGTDFVDNFNGNLYESSIELEASIANSITLKSGVTTLDRPFISAGTLTLSGNIDGAGGWRTAGSNNYVLSGANTYTGPTIMNGTPTLFISNDGNLGNGGELHMSGGTIVLQGNWTANRSLLINGAGTIDTNGFQATLNGALTGAATNPTIWNKAGAGTLTLNAQGDARASLAVRQGAVILRNSYALGAPSGGGTVGGGTATVTAGAEVQLQNNISVDNFFNINGTGVASGGALQSTGGSNTITNTITLSGNTSVGATSGARLAIAGGLNGGAFTLTKVGDGILEMQAAVNLTNTVTVSAGTLLVNNLTGSGTGTGPVQVNGGAALGGARVISGAVTLASTATLAPGNSVGTLTTGDADLQTGSIFSLEVDFVGNSADQLNVAGQVFLNGVGGGSGSGAQLQFTFLSGVVPTSSTQSFVIVRNDSGEAVNGTFDGIAQLTPYMIGQLQYVVDYASNDMILGTDGNDITVSFSYVPEPSGAVAALCVLGAAAVRRRRKVST